MDWDYLGWLEEVEDGTWPYNDEHVKMMAEFEAMMDGQRKVWRDMARKRGLKCDGKYVHALERGGDALVDLRRRTGA